MFKIFNHNNYAMTVLCALIVREYIVCISCPQKRLFACHCATFSTMLSNLCFVVTTHIILVCFAPVTLSRPKRSPHNGTLTSNKILSFLLAMSAGDASGGRGDSLAEENLPLKASSQGIPSTGRHQNACFG